MTNTYIPPELADKIKEAAVLEDIIPDYIQLRPSGSSQIGDCPQCGGKKKLSFTPSKKVWKCFACEIGGKDAASFLMKAQGKTYPEALYILADRYHIDLSTEEKPAPKKKHTKMKFRDAQLRASGIPIAAQKYWLTEGPDTKYELDRFQSASVDKLMNVIPGDDMVLHYLGLDGKPIMYKEEKGRTRALVRVRWANPALHTDKHGKPMRYKSPYGSGSHLWLPNKIIEAYMKKWEFETLYVVEGEKKAEKMCQHGMMAVGVMGISNFASGGEMPYMFELLIKTCGIKRVVFVLDSDWQELSLKDPSMPVDSRPNTFFRAVLRFKEYFYAYHLSGIQLELFFAYGKDIDFKGMDDLLVSHLLRKKEEELAKDFETAMSDREGKGEHVNCHCITQMSSYKLKEFWHLHSRPKFLKEHEEQLKELREFKFGSLKWRYNTESGEFEMADKIRPHEQYWHKVYDGEDKQGREKWKYAFNYKNILEFLRNRGFGLYETGPETYRFIRMEDRVVEETSAHKIQRFVIDFTRDIEEDNVLEMLLRGGKQYIGPDKLANMHYFEPEFNESDADTQYLYFKNVYWKITKDEIVERPLSELPRHIWKDKVVDFEAKYVGKPLMSLERKNDDWVMKATEEGKNCDMANFYARTSMFHWRKLFQLASDGEGGHYWAERKEPEQPSADDLKIWRANLAAKMVAAGYLLHDYTDWGNMKAIICMDGLESEVGKSQGGSGKGVYCSQFEQLVPVHWINGKRKNLEEDKHLYAGVDERTQVIYFEDVRVNFDFEQLFPGITRGTWVEKKGIDGHKEQPKKHLLDTNHGLSGEGNSFARRQFLLSFSDYYNKYRRVSDDFGYQLFEEWDEKQWNLFYNWLATCSQAFLKFRLEYAIPQDALNRRNLRQSIGENFIDWAELQFDEKDGVLVNHKFEKVWACERYLEQYPQDKRYVTPKKFKSKIIKYAEYAGLEFNPGMDGEDKRIKSNGKEYLILANKNYLASKCRMISSNADLVNEPIPY